ncbi:hypothetical protein TRVL_04964 [Trypanosoma vivax]|uniref:Uncharacterized protein n=1 Tax=Trypanosoma vivax (strain Y486) TaxID=1055687 RepID=G0U1U6_TRYVY|nr:hypothetical protein TRVL_04964 [Trypanosoma vivax]CCC50245.1 conserved hypothetical protein [Trypanosoma vivax Y486]
MHACVQKNLHLIIYWAVLSVLISSQLGSAVEGVGHSFASDLTPSGTFTHWLTSITDNGWYNIMIKYFRCLVFGVMVVGPHIGYLVQMYEMFSTNNVEGYSCLLSVILLSSNSIRLLYYLGYQFGTALFLQSILAVVVHSTLLVSVLCIARGAEVGESDLNLVRDEDEETGTVKEAIEVKLNRLVRNRVQTAVQDGLPHALTGALSGEVSAPESGPLVRRVLLYLDDCVSNFEKAVLRLTVPRLAVGIVLTSVPLIASVLLFYAYVVPIWKNAVHIVGYVALGIESMLLVPQILLNNRRKSTEGVALALLFTWVSGDIGKLVYFVLTNESLPFLICGGVQLLFDAVIVAQWVLYRRAED